MPTCNSIDAIIARLKVLAAGTSGFGTVSDAGVEFTIARRRKGADLEPLADFVARVQAFHQDGDTVVWQMSDGEYTLARITRRA